LANKLGIETLSASQVSEINKGLNEQVEAFRSRPLEEVYPVLWADAMYEKIRMNGRVLSMAVLIVTGINCSGVREILAIEPMYEESKESYTLIFNSLKQRGLKKVWLVVSDAHEGLKAAATKCFLGSSWQRCKVHFMRNILAHVDHKNKAYVAEKLKQICNQPDRKTALQLAAMFTKEFAETFAGAVETLQNGLEDSLQFFEFPKFNAKRISSTNMQERLHKEIRRRSRVVGIFPSVDSYLRLVTAYLIEYSDDWATSRAYIHPKSIEDQEAERKKAA
jgi:putative transposase